MLAELAAWDRELVRAGAVPVWVDVFPDLTEFAWLVVQLAALDGIAFAQDSTENFILLGGESLHDQ